MTRGQGTSDLVRSVGPAGPLCLRWNKHIPCVPDVWTCFVFVEHPSLTVPAHATSFHLLRNPPRHPCAHLAERAPQDPRHGLISSGSWRHLYGVPPLFSPPFSDLLYWDMARPLWNWCLWVCPVPTAASRERVSSLKTSSCCLLPQRWSQPLPAADNTHSLPLFALVSFDHRRRQDIGAVRNSTPCLVQGA